MSCQIYLGSGQEPDKEVKACLWAGVGVAPTPPESPRGGDTKSGPPSGVFDHFHPRVCMGLPGGVRGDPDPPPQVILSCRGLIGPRSHWYR